MEFGMCTAHAPCQRDRDEAPDALVPVGLSVNADSRTWTCALARNAEATDDETPVASAAS